MDTTKNSKLKIQNSKLTDHSFKFLAKVLTFDFCVLSLKPRRGFTLIELLIVIAIISILIGVLVPSISRSLSGNRLASDVEVMRAKIEETRLLAGSTQSADEQIGVELPDTDRVGYYGIYLPSVEELGDPSRQYYAIVKISSPLDQIGEGYCSAELAAAAAVDGTGSCLVERVDLTRNITFDALGTYSLHRRIIGFRAPSQQTVELFCPDSCDGVGNNIWQENPDGPKFNKGGVDGNYFKLIHQDKTATIKIEAYTGKLSVVYN